MQSGQLILLAQLASRSGDMPRTNELTAKAMPLVFMTFGYNSEQASGNGIAAASGSLASGTMPTNVVIAVPMFVWDTWIVRRLALVNGATVAGNWDIGVYTEDGQTKLVSTGSTAQSGANSYQGVNVTETVLAPGMYWVAFGTDSATQTIFRYQPGSLHTPLTGTRAHTVASGTGCPLPSSLTLAQTYSLNIPLLQAATLAVF